MTTDLQTTCRAFHLQALSLFKDAAEYDGWLRQISAPVLAIAGDKDALTPLVYPWLSHVPLESDKCNPVPATCVVGLMLSQIKRASNSAEHCRLQLSCSSYLLHRPYLTTIA